MRPAVVQLLRRTFATKTGAASSMTNKEASPSIAEKAKKIPMRGEQSVYKTFDSSVGKIRTDWWNEPYGRTRFTYWASWYMRKSVHHRELVQEYADTILRHKCIVAAPMLPNNEISRQTLAAVPARAHVENVSHRVCIVHGQHRGVVPEFRAQRMRWRRAADYAQLCGVKPATW